MGPARYKARKDITSIHLIEVRMNNSRSGAGEFPVAEIVLKERKIYDQNFSLQTTYDVQRKFAKYLKFRINQGI